MMNTIASSRRRNQLAFACCALLLGAFYITSRLSWRDTSATFDEPLHLMASLVQCHTGDFRCNPEDPPLWRYVAGAGVGPSDMGIDKQSRLWTLMLSVMGAEYRFSCDYLYENPAHQPDEWLDAARHRLLLLGVVLGMTIAWCAWRIAGRRAAVVAVALFSLDPNFLAHSCVVKNDVSITLVFLFLAAAVWRLGQKVTGLRALTAMALVGVAMVVKFSGILALPVVVLMLLCRALLPQPWPVLGRLAATRLRRLVTAAAISIACIPIAWLIIWACYDFRFGPSPDPAVRFDMNMVIDLCADRQIAVKYDPDLNASRQQIDVWRKQWTPTLPIRAAVWIEQHHLLPQTWIVGLLWTYGASLMRYSFFCGHISTLGRWYYFPMAMLFKTPLATLVALALAAVTGLALLWSRWRSIDLWTLCAMGLFPLIYFLVAVHSNLNLGLRHILPVYPFLYIMIGVVAATLWQRWPRSTTAILCVLAAGLAVETCSAFPDYIPFFNVAAGGERGGLNLLSDSNLDWGRELPALAQWQREHPDRQLYLSYFGTADPRYYGLSYINLPGQLFPYPAETRALPLPPVFAISATNLQGTYVPRAERAYYQPFLQLKPLAVLGGSIYLYDYDRSLKSPQ